jgi:hypothetical protein
MTRTHTEGNAQRAAWLLASHRVLSRTPLPFDRAAARRADRDPFDVTLLLEHPCLHRCRSRRCRSRRCRSRRCRSRRCRSRRCRLHRRAFIDVVLIDGQAQRERQPLSVVLLRLAGMPRSSILLPPTHRAPLEHSASNDAPAHRSHLRRRAASVAPPGVSHGPPGHARALRFLHLHGSGTRPGSAPGFRRTPINEPTRSAGHPAGAPILEWRVPCRGAVHRSGHWRPAVV